MIRDECLRISVRSVNERDNLDGALDEPIELEPFRGNLEDPLGFSAAEAAGRTSRPSIFACTRNTAGLNSTGSLFAVAEFSASTIKDELESLIRVMANYIRKIL